MKRLRNAITMYKLAGKQLIVLLGLLITYTAIKSQPKCKIEHYSTEDGLSHDIITYMYKDREGFMWFATWNGLNRFDGQRFVSFKSSPGDLSHLKNDRIDQITEDNYNHLWLKAYDGQIYRFDKKKETFVSLTSLVNLRDDKPGYCYAVLSGRDKKIWVITENDGLILVTDPQKDSSGYIAYKKNAVADFRLPNNTINFFHEDGDRTIWVGTASGLSYLVKGKDGVFRSNELLGSGNFDFTAVSKSKDAVYFGTNDGQVVVFDKKKNQFNALKVSTAKISDVLVNAEGTMMYATTAGGELITLNCSTQQVTKDLYNAHDPLLAIYEDRAGRLWLKSEHEGVVGFSPTHKRFKAYRQKNNASYNNQGDHYKVFEDNKGTVWIILKGGGFGYYNPATDKVEYFYNEPNSSTRLFSNIVNAIYYDNAGLMWIRTDERGIEKITFQRNQFDQYVPANLGLFQSDNEVRGLLQDRKHRLWIGLKGDRLYAIEKGKELTIHFENLPAKGLAAVYSMLQDRSGNIWLGTKGGGLYKATPLNAAETSYRLSRVNSSNNDASLPVGNEIYCLVEDSKGRIWAGSYDNGLMVVDPGRKETALVYNQKLLKDYPASSFRKIRHIATDRFDNIWVGTTDGLLVINTSSQEKFIYKSYQKIPGDINSLGNNNIQYIFKDAKNEMWLATLGGGLSKAIGNDPVQALKFQVYTTKNGLPNDYLLSCVEDKQQNLWIATQAGLAKLDPQRKIFRNYNSYDGVPKYAFSEASGILLNDGRLVFGTIKGFISYDPAAVADHPIEANIAFTNLQINNETVVPGSDQILQSSVNHTEKLVLDYDQNIISIDYIVLDYRSSNKQSYVYRLKGFDEQWQSNGSQHRTTYTNLRPGDYVFEVKCSNGELYTNTPYRKIAIVILPPPWKTWWAYTLYVVLAILLIELVRRTATTMLKLRNNIVLEKKMAELKMNFFTNVSHELRTPVTLIINPLEEIARHESLSERGGQYLEVVRKNAKRMGRFVNQLLDLRKLESGQAKLSPVQVDLVAFVNNIMPYFTELSRSNHVDFKLVHEEDKIEAWVDTEKLETVIYNLVANAFKFTPAHKTISIRISKIANTGYVSIEVADQGIGVPTDKLNQIFELFYAMNNEANKQDKGTGIGLALSKQIIELHGGTITATNNKDGGLTMRIELPQYQTQRKESPGTNQAHSEEVTVEDFVKEEKTVTSGLMMKREIPLVLLVEDNADLQFFLSEQLKDVYRVETAHNGKEGLEKAVTLLPDLVLSDVMMPVMDGIQLLDQLKNNIATSHIPVILLTAKSAIESQVEGLRYGADYYITKPFNNEFLFAAIQNIIRQRRKILDALLEGKKTISADPGEIKVTTEDAAFLQRVRDIVEEKMGDSHFDIDTVAVSMTMSRTGFFRKFKQLTGLAPVEFVREMRLQKSKMYLDNGQGNISEVAYAVGFNDAKYFSTCFKAKFQVSPSEYLRRAKASMK